MAVSELINAPIDVKLNGADYKISRLSIGEIWGLAESSVLKDYYQSVQSVASMLTGAEKMAYLKDATKSAPKGSDLQDDAQKWIQSMSGVSALIEVALNKHQKVSQAEIVTIIINDPGSIEFVVSHLIGVDPDKKKQ